jgi:hypothetical protein
MAFLIVALVLAALPAPSVFAAAEDGKDAAAIDNLETLWSYKIRNIHAQSDFYDHVRLYPADFKNSDDLARAYDLLHLYGSALRGAETVIANHYGFDAEGHVMSLGLADQSVKDLAYYLHIMRGLREKLDSVPRKGNRR